MSGTYLWYLTDFDFKVLLGNIPKNILNWMQIMRNYKINSFKHTTKTRIKIVEPSLCSLPRFHLPFIKETTLILAFYSAFI